MTIRYSLQRTDIWEAYWHQWRSGWKLKAAQIVIALSVFYIALNWLNPATPVEAAMLQAPSQPPSLFPPAEPAAASRICAASRRLHRHYRMRRKRRAARRNPPSGGPQFNVKTLGGLRDASRPRDVGAVVRRSAFTHFDSCTWCL